MGGLGARPGWGLGDEQAAYGRLREGCSAGRDGYRHLPFLQGAAVANALQFFFVGGKPTAQRFPPGV